MAFFRRCKLKEIDGDRLILAWMECRITEKERARVSLKDFAGVRFKVVEIYEPELEAKKEE